MPRDLQGELDARGVRLAIVVSRFNSEVTEPMLQRAILAIGQCGGDVERIPLARVPGSLELAVAAQTFATSNRYDAVLCIGCVIRGETAHYDCVVNGTTQGITAVAAQTGVPIIFGVLTCDTDEQAAARLDTGAYAARAAIEMANLLKKIRAARPRSGSRPAPRRRRPVARRKPRA
jgi:6,7-dimethyl-8-ribityllumazine synthase